VPKEMRTALDVLAPFEKHQEVFDALVLSLSGEADEHAALPPDMPVISWERGAAAAKIATSKEFITRVGAGKKPNARQLVLRALWALLRAPDDFGAAIGDVVAAGWDTDCNGATVGALWALQNKAIPEAWTRPWNGCIGVSLAGREAADVDDLAERTAEVARRIE